MVNPALDMRLNRKRYNETSLKLQSSTCDLKLAVDLLESLHTRNRFDEFAAKAKEVSSASESWAEFVEAWRG